MLVKVNEHFMIEIPAEGGNLREGVIGYPRYINPLLTVTDSGRDLSALIYSGLLKTEDGGELVPDLAKSYTISSDELTYDFILKDNITFHDGTPVTAYDVEFTVNKALDPAIKSPKAANFDGVTVKAISDKEVQFVLKKPYAPFLQNLTLGILPKHIWKDIDPDAFVFSEFNFSPVGSGPYKIKNIQRNSSGLPLSYELVPFDKYALGKPHISTVSIYFYTNEDDLMNAFENGDITSMNSITPKNIDTVKSQSTILEAPLPRIFGVFFNQNQAAIFTNKEVRQALDEAVDRQDIINQVLGGHGTPDFGALPAELSKQKDSGETADERLSNAANILAKAGWKKGDDGTLVKTVGKQSIPLTFSLSTSNTPELKKTADLLATVWGKLGAKVDVKVFDIADLETNVIRPRKYDALLFGEVIGRDLDLFAFWHSSERNDPGLNMAMYTNPKTDKLLETARGEEDSTKRMADLTQAEGAIASDTPAVFLYSPNFIYVVPKDLGGVSLDGITSSSERFLNVENWYMDTDKVWTVFKDSIFK